MQRLQAPLKAEQLSGDGDGVTEGVKVGDVVGVGDGLLAADGVGVGVGHCALTP